ncbi:MAG: YdcF family protein [Sulfuricellaceae bacterium]|nr:YdcF family protein [Sulfuricellaceae bacterium]
MFELAKLVGWLLSPLVLALLLLGVALLLIWRGHRRCGLGAGLMAVLGLWTVAMPLVATALAYPLERRFPAVLADQAPQADVIVLLGGALGGARPPERPSFDLGGGADRVWHAAALFHAGRASSVLVSGGNQPGADGVQVEAEAMRSMLLTLGVPASAIRTEGLSRNTAENARQSLGLIQVVGAKRVLLVTSALHMPRALRTFQAALSGSGVTVLPASTDVEALPDSLHPLGRWLPDAESLALSTRALKEYLGLAALAMRGL